MGFWNKMIENFMGVKQTVSIFLGLTPRRYQMEAFSALAREGYQTNPYVYAAIDVIAKNVSTIEFTVIDRKRGNVEVKKDDLVRLLKTPNPSQSWKSFVKQIVVDFYISGNVYILATDTKKPAALYILRPDKVSIVRDSDMYSLTPIKGYRYGNKQYSPKEVLHIKNYNPLDDLYGLSPLTALSKSIILSNRAKDWNINLLENNARPSGALISKERLSEKQIAFLRQQINEIYSSPENAGRPLILEGGLDWKEMSLRPSDLNWQEVINTTAKEIAVALGIPVQIFLRDTGTSNAGFRNALKSLFYNTIFPFCDLLIGELNRWLVPMFNPDYEIVYDKDDVPALSEDAVQVWDRVIRARLAGILTKNEARRFLDQPDMPEDDMYQPANVLIQDILNSGMINPNTIRREGGDEE
jgi:HK97 family phage portal protein